jgi:hypothetical protein
MAPASGVTIVLVMVNQRKEAFRGVTLSVLGLAAEMFLLQQVATSCSSNAMIDLLVCAVSNQIL